MTAALTLTLTISSTASLGPDPSLLFSQQGDEKYAGQTDGLPALPIFVSARSYASQEPLKIAIIDESRSERFTYAQLLRDTAVLKTRIAKQISSTVRGAEEPRVTFLVPAGYDYVVTQWAVWAAGAICVPLCTTHPVKELLYTIRDSEPALVIIYQAFAHLKQDLQNAIPSVPFANLCPHQQLPRTLQIPQLAPTFPVTRRPLIIYTSGTTSRPKGCVTTHQNIISQATSLIEAWKYSSDDHLIHILPLHHIHGIINGLTATLLAGGTVEMHSKFDAEATWRRWSVSRSSTMFMAVPTVYSRLIDYFNANIRGTPCEDEAREGARSLRLLISGSAALPITVKT